MIRYFRPLRGRESRAFRRVVDELLDSGEIALSRRGTYRLAVVGDSVVGEIVRERGRLWFVNQDGRRLALAAGSGLRVGDRVAGLVEGDAVTEVSVLEPAPEPVIGVLCRAGRSLYVDSLDPDLKGRIDLVTPATARSGAIVEVHIETVLGDVVRGRVTGLVEAGNEAARAAEALLTAHRIPRAWAFDLSQLNVPQAVTERDIEGRLDLRDLPLVTIDGADARDFDDAVFAEPHAAGGWRLVVAIADVAHYVRAGSALDQDARWRGNSLYLPDRVVPMLPEALSNGICSLVPDQDRLAVVCDMRVSAKGRVSNYRFHDAVIRSHARLTYAGVDDFLGGGDLQVAADVAASLGTLHDVYRAFRARRAGRGALDFESREASVRLRDGRPVAIELAPQTDAHRLIEEAMIAANVAAAGFLEARCKAAPSGAPHALPVYRVHEPPSRDKLEALAVALRLTGESPPGGTVTAAELTAVCERARAKSRWPRWIWEAIVLRTLAQARYETRHLGHFGLALPSYAHFTSPIRRYADLLNHRAIKGEPTPPDELATTAAHISMTERRAEDVERAVAAWLKCALLEPRIGETLPGTVVAVLGFGLFVELDGLFVQGLLHISKLGRDYYHYVPETMSLVAERSGARFALADRVEVIVEDVSVASGRIDLALARRPRRAGRDL